MSDPSGAESSAEMSSPTYPSEVPVFLVGRTFSETKSLTLPHGEVCFTPPPPGSPRAAAAAAASMYHVQVGGFGHAYRTVLSVSDERVLAELIRFEEDVTREYLRCRARAEQGGGESGIEPDALHATLDHVAHNLGWIFEMCDAGYLLDASLHLCALRASEELLALFPPSKYPATVGLYELNAIDPYPFFRILC